MVAQTFGGFDSRPLPPKLFSVAHLQGYSASGDGAVTVKKWERMSFNSLDNGPLPVGLMKSANISSIRRTKSCSCSLFRSVFPRLVTMACISSTLCCSGVPERQKGQWRQSSSHGPLPSVIAGQRLLGVPRRMISACAACQPRDRRTRSSTGWDHHSGDTFLQKHAAGLSRQVASCPITSSSSSHRSRCGPLASRTAPCCARPCVRETSAPSACPLPGAVGP
jgi:hypothetical protein